MKPTRLVAIAIILGSFAVSAPNAQTLREARPPAEFPPASFKGRQYVDSRGCVYVRAGVGGSVTWVPRVTRARKQICGYKPTAVAGTTGQPAQGGPAPTVITIAPPADKKTPAAGTAPKASAARAAAAPAAPTVPARKAAPAVGKGMATAASGRAASARPAGTLSPRPPAATAKTKATGRVVVAAPPVQRTTTARPATTATRPAAATTRPAPGGKRRPAAASAPRKAAPVCPNASAFSQQFINRTGVRCGPQSEPPVTYVTGSAGRAGGGAAPGRGGEVAALPPDTVVIPRHIHEQRQNTTDVAVPRGYKPVWKDGRLNPRRGERTLRPAEIRNRAVVPRGFRAVSRKDDRYNLRRGVRTAAGDAQTDMIWTRTVPRRLVPASAPARVVRLPAGALVSPAEVSPPRRIRITSRSASGAAPGGRLAAGRPRRQPGGGGAER